MDKFRKVPLILSLIAVGLSSFSAWRADSTYSRIVQEVWELFKPAYRDLNISVPPEPKTLTEVLEPVSYKPLEQKRRPPSTSR